MLARLAAAAAAGRLAARPLSLAMAAAPSPRPGLAPVSPFLSTAVRRFSSAPPPDLTPAQLALYRLMVEQDAAQAKRAELLRQENRRLFDAMAGFIMDRAGASAGGENAAHTVALSALMVASLTLIYMTVRSYNRADLANKEAANLEKAALVKVTATLEKATQDLLDATAAMEKAAMVWEEVEKAAEELLDAATALGKAAMPGEGKVPTAEETGEGA